MENKNLYSEEEIDDYVFKALEKQKSDLAKEIKGMRMDSELARIDRLLKQYEEGYNQAIDDILEVLNKNKKHI